MNLSYTFSPVAFVRSPYPQKFGIPRQPQLAPDACCRIEFLPQFGAQCVRGLDGFDFVWVQFVFHDALDEGWAQTVRPPRLGGKKKMGVFATRSPHRPNPIGLSLLKLDRVVSEDGRVVLLCGGTDLLDGTPVLDVKPYLPFVEAHADARSGFVSGAPVRLAVEWLPGCGAEALPEALRRLIGQSVAQDPRPAYQDAPDRVYGMRVGGAEVRFRIEGETARIVRCEML